jgi:DNA-directed RNA polymerase subunit E'/Rpb7
MYRSCFIEEQAILTPREFDVASVDLDGYLAMQLKKKMEGKCSPQGFVRENSLQLLSRSLGQTKAGTFTGDFLFRCKLRCDVLYPAVGDFVDVDVLKINKMGAYAAFEDSLRVLMPRDLHLGSSEFDSLAVGDRIRIKILKTRFQSHDAFIMAVGTFEEIIGKGQVPSIASTVEKLDEETTSEPASEVTTDVSAPILEQ